ncbi:MAG: hypothetical protein IH624_01805, partial [Phycisphaerae bacterium]|nr:hypothetical protein [Phycisphaerae bacterium]
MAACKWILTCLMLSGWGLCAAAADGPAAGDVRADAVLERLERIDLEAVRLAVADMSKRYEAGYPRGAAYLERIAAYEAAIAGVREGVARGDAAAIARAEEIIAFTSRVLLENPLLDFGRLV